MSTMFPMNTWCMIIWSFSSIRVRTDVLPSSSFSTCLSDAVPAAERRNIWQLSGGDDADDGLPLGIVVADWSSARLGSYLIKYLAEEVLGYKTTFSCVAELGSYQYMCTANCEHPTNVADPGCSKSRVSHSSINHLSWELWDGSWKTAIDSVSAQLGSSAPEKVGTVGFIAVEGIYAKDSDAQAVLSQESVMLEYYKTWKVSSFDPSKFFTSISSIPENLLKPCKDTTLYWNDDMTQYKDLSNDLLGVETRNGNIVAKCWGNTPGPDGRYWMSPACRQNTTRCVMFVTNKNWYLTTAMFQAQGNELPIAIAVATSDASWETLARDYNVLYYWFDPDMRFYDLNPHLLRFPPNDPAAWARGDKSTEARPISVSKYVNPLLKDESRAYTFFKNMELKQPDINAIMSDLLVLGKNQGINEATAACNWLKSNRPVWQKWIPDATVCALGYGIVNGNGVFMAHKNQSTACKACTPGKFSQITEDSATHACVQCAEGRSSAARAAVCNEALVEEPALSTFAIIMIILGVIVFCLLMLCCFCGYFRKHVKLLRGHIMSLEQEVKDLQDSAVNMRVVKVDYYPRVDADMVASKSVGSKGSKGRSEPEQRAIWYWQEDEGRMAAHSPTLTMPPNWVQYAGSVAVDLEEAYQLYQKGAGPEELGTDLADRISSTGTESKAHGTQTGTKFRVNFRDMKQINATSGYKRNILRNLVATAPTASPSPPGLMLLGDDLESGTGIGKAMTGAKPLTSNDVVVPDELKDETLLVLSRGSIVQISKQRPDGWVFGNVLLLEGDEEFSKVELISYDAGWFPVDCVEMATKDDLERLAKMMGPAGADTLAPPKVWTQMKDPALAEQVLVTDAQEKQKVVDWFGKTLMGRCPVVKVERIQNLSLWQSFAVKRQTIKSRDGSASTADCERVWLFHGTNAETVSKIIQQGFNRSFCGKNATMYGKGVYFARDAAYSARATYSIPDSSGIQRMFLCRVVVGEYCKGVKDALAPDPRDKTGHLLYDTTVDTVKDPSIFVTYHDAQAYPDYLVYFKTN